MLNVSRRLVVALLLISVIVTVPTYLTYGIPSAGQTATISGAFPLEKGCSFLIFTDGTTTYAQNCDTSAIAYSGLSTSSDTVINSAIAALTSGGRIFVKAGSYQLSGQVVGAVSNVVLAGEGVATRFTLVTAFTHNIMTISGSNWKLQDFKIEATNQTKGLSLVGLSIVGSNTTVSGLTIHNVDHCNIYVISGGNNLVQGNFLTDAYDDGICVANAAYDVVITGNFINQATNRNCISIVSSANVTVTNNIAIGCVYGLAVENLGAGPVRGLHSSNNQWLNNNYGIVIYPANGGVESADDFSSVGDVITSALYNGIWVQSGKGISIVGDSISTVGSHGIYIASGVISTQIESNLINSTYLAGIYLATSAADVLINGNTFMNNGGTASYGAISSQTTVNNVTVTNNMIRYPQLTGSPYGISLSGTNLVVDSNTIRMQTPGDGIFLSGTTTGFSVSNNKIYGKAGTGNTVGVLAGYGTLSYGQIHNNLIVSCYRGIFLHANVYNTTVMGNTMTGCSFGIVEDTSSDSNIIAWNVITGPSAANRITVVGNRTVTENNAIYNPIRKVTNFLLTGGTGAGDGNWLSPSGTSSTLTASTTYYCSRAACTVIIIAVGSASISINGGTSFTPPVGGSYTLQPNRGTALGDSINFGAFGGSPPTIQVNFA